MDGSVTIIENGREGKVNYHEPAGSLSLHWEFSGGDVVASIRVGTEAEWSKAHPWAVERRASIVRSIAAEVVRQKAPTCIPEMDEASGWLHLRQNQGATARSKAVAQPGFSMARYRSVRMRFAVGVGIAALIAGALMWFKNKVLVIDPGKGIPFGSCVRTDAHIATLIETLEPYTPSLHRDHSKDRHRLSVFLVPLDGSVPRCIPLIGDLTPGAYSLGKILGSDGRTLWSDAAGLHGVDLRTFDVVRSADLHELNPSLDPMWFEDSRGMEVIDGRLRMLASDRSAAYALDPATRKATAVEPRPSTRYPFAPALTNYLAAGLYTSPTSWLGLHSPKELEGEFKVKRWVRPVEGADDAKEMRRLCKAKLDPVSDDRSHRILSIAPIGDTTYLNAAFLRMDEQAEPLRASDPDGAFMIWTSAPGLIGTLMVARVDTEGKILWATDTGIDRFKLSQILPGATTTAFVGPRLPIPDKLSEPLLVIIDHRTGKASTIPLWQ